MRTWTPLAKKSHTGCKMKRHATLVFVILLLLTTATSCAALSESQKREYGLLGSAVTTASDVVTGEYGDDIPPDFNAEQFMILVKGKIPDDYYDALKDYQLDVEPKGRYYLLVVFAADDKSIIMFDYSCNALLDGPVELEPGKYDLEHLDLYDDCKDF